MSKFVSGTGLTLSIENIIRNAQSQLIFIAPSLILNTRLKEELKRKKIQDEIQLIFVFGKVNEDITNSISKEDLEFLTDFPNVVICYEEKLGAKYYANEKNALLSSINLSDFGQINPVEAGMALTAKGMLGQLTGNLTSTIAESEKSSWELATEFFTHLIEKSKELYRKTPQYDKGFMNLTKKYSRSVVETNKLDDFFAAFTPSIEEEKFIQEVQELTPLSEVPSTELIPETVPEIAAVEPEKEFTPGFCIRTGVAIPFDPRNPFSPMGLADWRKDPDTEYPENYCHFSGEPSYGMTSVNRPVLQKNLKKAQMYF